jgi:carbamoyl-phosphate synthase large subunit
MKSVGEVMAIGRTFKEALQKGLQSLEVNQSHMMDDSLDNIRERLRYPNPDRINWIQFAFTQGMKTEEIYSLSHIHPWFIQQIQDIVELRKVIHKDVQILKEAKRWGFPDKELAGLLKMEEKEFRNYREKNSILPTIKSVDTCAAEFPAYTPYYYTSYEDENEFQRSKEKNIIILGSGPNRIGQGIEFDYCCVHASLALQEEGYDTVMINTNPETVSTDYDISTRLYFDPLTFESVLNIVSMENPMGVILQFGGQTPLRLAALLKNEGVNILGTPPEEIHRAEDRKAFKEITGKLGLNLPESETAFTMEEARKSAKRIGFPLILRPSYVLGGQAMEIIYDQNHFDKYVENALSAYPDSPILIEEFLEDAVEVDVDGISDGDEVLVGAVMEHIEEAGIHSGDSACVIPPYSISESLIKLIGETSRKLAHALHIQGLFNLQYAVKKDTVYILEANPRASRTIPYVSKTIGIPLAKIAARTMVGRKLKELIPSTNPIRKENGWRGYVSVKKPVFPFVRLPGVDLALGPEMRSTGEVMGIDQTFGRAYAKAHLATDEPLPTSGNAFISVNDHDKRSIILIAKKMEEKGFKIYATKGTAQILLMNGIPVKSVHRVGDGKPDGLRSTQLKGRLRFY